MSNPFPFQKVAQDGSIAMRDGLVFAVFVPAPHSRVGDAFAELMRRYLAFVGEKHFTMVHDRGEYYRPITSKKVNALIGRMQKQAPCKVEFQFSIRDGDETKVPGHYFSYSGGIEDAGPLETSHLEVWYPAEYLDEIGPDPFVKHIQNLAEAIPFSYGYCSLSLNYLDWAAMGARPYARSIALRHPGVDVRNIGGTGMYLGEGARGAYWLTLLGEPALARLEKDAVAMSKELGEGIQVDELANGVSIRAGERPQPGDVNENDRLPLIRKVAALIAPIQVIDREIVFGDKEEWIKWQRRHLL
jgi:hypothetical protein